MTEEKETVAKSERTKVIWAEASSWEHDYLTEQSKAAGWDYSFVDGLAEELSAKDRKAVQVLSCFIGSTVDAKLLDSCPNLKLITNRSTGYDRIDVAACNERGITVCNVPRYGENTVAEHTFGLILALSRNIYQAVDRAKRGDFSTDGLRGFDLYGKTLGLIGAGSIGLHVIRMARALNMRVLVYDVRPQRLMAEVLTFEYADLETVLSEADVLTIHTPLLPSTYHLVDAGKLALMKPSAVIINTSRGGVVDSAALLDALNSNRLAGAALDVLECEEVITEDRVLLEDDTVSPADLFMVVDSYKLMHHPKVIITPHIAFYSQEALQRILATTIDNVKSFLAGNTVSQVRESTVGLATEEEAK